MTSKLQGIFTPNIVPLDSRGQINEPELRRYVDWLIERGVHGLYPNGSTGEFTRFTVEERRRIIKIVCEQCGDRAPVLAGAAEANVKETIAACELYHSYGARAVAIVSPFYYKLSPESVYAYFSEIARNSPIDVTLYNIPMFASPIDVPTLRRLAEEFPRIVGIKDSSGDVAFMGRMINAIRPVRPEFSFLTGWDVVLVPMMLMGADGGTNATSGVVPELMRRIYDLAAGKRWDQAMPLQLRLIELFDAMLFSADFPEGFRAGVELRGFDMGKGRQPMSDKQRGDRGKLKNTLQCILSDFNAVESPNSCEPRPLGGVDLAPNIDVNDFGAEAPLDQTVRDVTEAVMARLRGGKPMTGALGILEIRSWSAAIAALDAADKAGDIELIQIELNDFLGAVVKFSGSVGDVRAAVSAGEAIARQMQAEVVSDVIPAPTDVARPAVIAPPEYNVLIEQDVVHFPNSSTKERPA